MDAAQGFFDAEERDFCVGELLLERDGQRDGAAGADVGEVCAAVGLAQAVAEERDGGAGGVGGEGLVDGVDVDGDFGAPGVWARMCSLVFSATKAASMPAGTRRLNWAWACALMALTAWSTGVEVKPIMVMAGRAQTMSAGSSSTVPSSCTPSRTPASVRKTSRG